MKIINETLWQTCREKNPDEPNGDYTYGSVVNHLAEQWADEMEKAMANGETLEQCAKRTFSEVDQRPQMGITGFQYGAVISTLAGVWAHGDELRKWHNADYGIAPEEPGVVNPAILTIG